MSKTDGQVKKNKVQELILPSDGQDGGLMAFINSLTDQNAELAAKLENIDSLMELAEKTVIEAGKEAEAIRAEAEREANARAADINMLAVLPEVEKVSDEPVEVGKTSSAHRKGNGPTPRTIAVAMKR
jgi:hypothetical protein